MYPSKQSFLVLGLSRSGKSATEFLLSKNAAVYIYDDLSGERIEQTAIELEKQGAKRITKTDLESMPKRCDVLVLSPGIPIDHPIAVSFKRGGKSVVGESEFAAIYMRCPIVAVTGTNGKTTTVSMLTDVFNRGGMGAKACGNIGTPMLDFHNMTEEIAVAEISSFQLETLNSLRPHVAVVLNITEDHLNRHYSMENYVFLKAKLLKNLTPSEYAVLNYDDITVRKFAEKTKGKVVYFSVRERVNGAYFENGGLYFGNEKILSVDELPLSGLHNVQNALAVIAVAKILGVDNKAISSALSDFKGIKHRVEYVTTINGVRFVDDSKGTNVDATIKAVECMEEETLLLLGGKDKGYDYNKLFEKLKESKVVHAVLYGENRYSLLKSARMQGFEHITVCKGMEIATRIAILQAKTGQCVLLSPASASFDEFTGYEERGDKFVEIVRSLKEYQEEVEEIEEIEEETDEIETSDEFEEVYEPTEKEHGFVHAFEEDE